MLVGTIISVHTLRGCAQMLLTSVLFGKLNHATGMEKGGNQTSRHGVVCVEGIGLNGQSRKLSRSLLSLFILQQFAVSLFIVWLPV